MKYISILAPLFLLCSCVSTYNLPKIDRPEDSNLEVWILDNINGEQLKENGLTYLPGWFGAEEWLGSKYEVESLEQEDNTSYALPATYVTYLFSGYPDLSDPWVCTKITIKDPEIHFYGLGMKSSKEEIDTKMKELSFEDKGNKGVPTYTKNSVSFSFGEDVISIYTAQATNKNNIVY